MKPTSSSSSLRYKEISAGRGGDSAQYTALLLGLCRPKRAESSGLKKKDKKKGRSTISRGLCIVGETKHIEDDGMSKNTAFRSAKETRGKLKRQSNSSDLKGGGLCG